MNQSYHGYNYLISIIVPVYNAEQHIRHTILLLSGIIAEEEDIEIIFVDDCSTDNTVNIINSLLSKNMLLINNYTNKGTFTSREIGTRKAQGQYILYCDADDVLVSNIKNILIPYLIRDKELDCILFNIADIVSFGVFPWMGSVGSLQKDFFDIVRCNKLFRWNIWGVLYLKSILLETYDSLKVNDRLTKGEDMLLFITSSYFVQKAILIPHIGYHYNKTNVSSITSDYTLNNAIDELKQGKLIIDYLNKFVLIHNLPDDTFLYTTKIFASYLENRINNYKITIDTNNFSVNHIIIP